MKIIDITDLRLKKSRWKAEYLREFDDYYEYCFIKDYEMKYNNFCSQSIQLADAFVTLLELKTKTIRVSLLFPKTFDLHEVAEWLNSNQISFNEKDSQGYYISNATSITEVVTFKGLPIVIAGRGNEKVYYELDDLPEVTDQYENYSQIVNTSLAKPVDISSKSTKTLIYFNGEKLAEVPHIDFDMSTDEIFVNGVFVAADYLDEYCDGVAFYREEDDLIPIVFFVGSTPVHIFFEEGENGHKLCVVEQEPGIDDLVNDFRRKQVEIEDFPDKDDCLGRGYPGVSEE